MTFTIRVAGRNKSNRTGPCRRPIAGFLAISATMLGTAWAADTPDKVAGLAGIYPVFDLRIYPVLEKATLLVRLLPRKEKKRGHS